MLISLFLILWLESEMRELRNCTSENYTLYESNKENEHEENNTGTISANHSHDNYLIVTNQTLVNSTIFQSGNVTSKSDELPLNKEEEENGDIKSLEIHKNFASGNLKITYTMHRHPTIEVIRLFCCYLFFIIIL